MMSLQFLQCSQVLLTVHQMRTLLLFQMDCSRPKYSHKRRGKVQRSSQACSHFGAKHYFPDLDRRTGKEQEIKSGQSNERMPKQLGVGLAIHQAFCSKEIIKMLHGFVLSVEYNRLLRSRVEAEIERSVIWQTKQNDGVYLPPDIVLGTQVFFTIDNIDSQKTLMMVERLSMGQLWPF